MTVSNRQVMIREFEGDLTPFDAAGLQTRLIGCFLAAGLRESVDLPQDITLAVEYTLRNAPRNEPVFGRGEVECAVIRLLEEIGFPEVARIYRSGGGAESIVLVTPERDTVAQLLRGHIGAAGELFERVVDRTVAALKTLEIPRAAAHLVLELARHYERELEQRGTRCAIEHTAEITLSAAAVVALLEPAARELVAAGVLRVDGVTTLFPRVHLFFRIGEVARRNGLHAPVTELELLPLLYRLTPILAGVQQSIEKQLGRELPLILEVPDMFDFVSDYAGGEKNGSSSLAAELGEVLASGFPRGVYKLNLN